MKRLTLLVAVLGLLLHVGEEARAGVVLDFTGGTATALPTFAETVGWEFTVSSPITVSALGLWDEQADGFVVFGQLCGCHEIGLWNALGATLLASALITNDNSIAVPSISSAGDWRFTPIVPITLAPGDYFVGAHYAAFDQDAIRSLTNTPSTIAGVTFFTSALVFGTDLTEPSEAPGNSPGIFGPNLFVGSLPVPEPLSWLLLGSGLAGLIVWRWKIFLRKFRETDRVFHFGEEFFRDRQGSCAFIYM